MDKYHLRFAVVWPKDTPLTGASLFVVPWADFDSTIHNFYTCMDVPNPDTLT